ncbi:MAG TPA: nucleotidyl transferase AbiEii/AbiGii toxin family protein [archaeon]|nr:nucleotidyl transferase AbiEii/AbiGii toxin family protein [archaeon]
MEFEQTKRILAAFDRHRVDYVLVGAMAMAAQGVVRATRDIDVVVSAEARNVDRLKTALRELFDDPEIDNIRADELAGEYPAIQYVPPAGDFWIDIVARLGEAFRFADIESEDLVVDGVRVRVATPRMLYRMKKNTVRPQDRLDAQILAERFDLREE